MPSSSKLTAPLLRITSPRVSCSTQIGVGRLPVAVLRFHSTPVRMAASTPISLDNIAKRYYSDLNASSPDDLPKAIFPNTTYSDAEQSEVSQWLADSPHYASAPTSEEDTQKFTERLSSLNTHLSTRTTLLGTKPSIADVTLYAHLSPTVSSWSEEQRTGRHGHHHIVRYIDFLHLYSALEYP